MFKGIVNWFKSGQDPLGVKGEEKPGFISNGETAMTARILEIPGGKFALFSRGETVGTYSRRRDAVRGATRRGLTVA